MTFAIITHVSHILSQNRHYAYAPYVNEMNIWIKYADKILIVAPQEVAGISPIQKTYQHENIIFFKVKSFDLLGLKSIISSIFKIPVVVFRIFIAMKKADHIHLRCPGNMGLLGCIIQIFFPKKIKTAKYAGNWNRKSKQPWSYRLQRWILSNTFLTRNMQVLVYGRWENATKNILPFFTASYSESEKEIILPQKTDGTVNFVFAGTLVSGKNPMYAVRFAEKLHRMNQNITLEIFGDGPERSSIENYISENNLENFITLHGNQPAQKLKEAYQQSHFVILPSDSEGWPKAIAEGMFWGCVPIATKVSCVPFMLDYGKRGVLIHTDNFSDVDKVNAMLNDSNSYNEMSEQSRIWSQQYTLDVFETAIKNLINS
ncbi:glycosyltransferase family 4 protein [Flavobacterium sp. 3HN19-14]|uniref:glycosyltransferase family 4 protein n=1 Tax=Flavobacterium sp. 3HN19-14 TaxID=3448133 RepID=UPI003EDF7D48